jgi:pimeloyl-ACP methyl ester carboxylesterase
MQVIANNVACNYEEDGEGPVMLMLHGWQDSLRTFDPLVPQLARHFRTVRLDLPGFGKSQAPPVAWSLQDYVETVQAFLRKLELKADVLVGHSLGGRVLIKGIAAGELKAKRLVLLASAGIGKSNSLRNRAYKVVAKTGKFLTAMPGLSLARKPLRQKLYTAVRSDYLAAGELKATFVRIVNEDLRQAAASVKLPTLLIWGDRDTETLLMDGRLMNRLIKGSRLEALTGAGHFVHHEEPDQVSKLIMKFAE